MSPLHRMLFFAVIFLSTATLSKISRVYEVWHRDHYHDLMQDLPVGMRYASVVAFYNDTGLCKASLDALSLSDHTLPNVEHLFLGKYDFSKARDRVWYNYEDHLDLPKNLGVDDYISNKEECECPIMVFVPATYADEIGDNYLANPSTEKVQIWDSEQDPDLKTWIWKNLEMNVRLIMALPFDYEITVEHAKSNAYLKSQGKALKEIIKVDSLQSHYLLTAFPGDTFYVSKDPDLGYHLKKERGSLTKTVPSEPKKYVVHAGMTDLNLIELEEGNWGFDDNRPEGLNPMFLSRRHDTTSQTHTRNAIIPAVIPAVHSKGFVKLPMPPGLHERLKAFYRKWYHLKVDEGWRDQGTQLNFYKVKTEMITLDHNFTERNDIAQNVLQPMVLEWVQESGGDHVKSLEFTAFYGIREYHRGASLRNHVDRIETHVFIVILQVGQTGIDKPWPLQVIGHDGVMYDITLEPGEMIFYESLILIHGRPYPFEGDVFANAFCHFKPTGWDWTLGKAYKSQFAKDVKEALHTR